MLTPKHLTQSQIGDLIVNDVSVLAPRMGEAVTRALARCARVPKTRQFPDGLNTRVYETERTSEVQLAYWQLGRDEEGHVVDKEKIVTNVKDPKHGWHFYRLATDVINARFGWQFGDSDHADDDELEWIRAVASIFESEGLSWGGRWKSIKDWPHFQWGKCAPSPVRSPAIYQAARDAGQTHDQALWSIWLAVGACYKSEVPRGVQIFA